MRHRPARPTRPALALSVLTLLAATGCGEDRGGSDAAPTGDREPAATASTTQVATATDADACPLVPLGDAETAVGLPLRQVAAGPAGCVLAGRDDAGVQVTVTATAIAIDPADYASQTRDLCDDEPVDSPQPAEGTTAAFVCSFSGRAQGFWFRDAASVTVQVEGLPDAAAPEATLRLVGVVDAPA